MPVCIAGMHRSGTSMVTKLLYDAGLDLGDEADFIPAGDNNPEGFWENRRFVRVNRRLLRALGADWDCPPAADPDWSRAAFSGLREEAAAVIDGFADRACWGWKDPRNCITLPFWQDLAGPLRVVVVVRNPYEVALSLRERNGFSYALGLHLWRRYNEHLLAAAPPSDRIVTHFDRFFGDDATEIDRLGAFLELPRGKRDGGDPLGSRVAALRHHRSTARDLARIGASPHLIALYASLCAEAGWDDGLAGGPSGGSASDDSTDEGDEGEPALDRSPGAPVGSKQRSVRGRPGGGDSRLRRANERIAELQATVRAQTRRLGELEALQRAPTQRSDG